MTRSMLKLVASILIAMGFVGTFLASNFAHAIQNPLIRTCTIALGNFEVQPLGTDDMALCRWNQLVVDSQTLLSNLDGLNSEAASVILSDMTAASCASVTASEYTLPTGEVLCFFSDDSRLSLEGLKAGLSDPDRLHLKQFLLAR